MIARGVRIIVQKVFIEDGIAHYLARVCDYILFNIFYRFIYKKNFLYYGNNVRWGKHGHFRLIPKSVRVSGSHLIHISDNVHIDECVYLQANPSGEGIFLGKSVRINAHSHIQAFSKIDICDYVLIAPFSHVNSGNHGTSNEEPIMFQEHVPSKSIYIGEGSWLGHSSTLLGGAKLLDNSVVGANTVVTKAYEKRCILVGVSAKNILIDKLDNQ